MPNYRYVSQGEYYITTDPNTILITSGMTDCIAIEFVDKANPDKRLLSHLDGAILYNLETGISNLKIIKEAFMEKTHSEDFAIHLLGGQTKLHNYRVLLPALKHLELDITHCVDINEFCQQLNVGRSRLNLFTPISVSATMVCPPSLTPEFISFKPSYFSPSFSEDALVEGKGLSLRTEQTEYHLFERINDRVLSSYPETSRVIRTSADQEWIASHQSILSQGNISGL